MMTQNYIYGLHAVLAAIKQHPDHIAEIFFQKNRKDQRIQAVLTLAQKNHISLQTVSTEMLESFVGNVSHQGVVARKISGATSTTLSEHDLSDICSKLSVPPFLLILDGVQDPHNLGACLRTADAAGVHAVIAPKDNSVGLTPTVCKVACGAAENVPFIQVTNLARTLKSLQDQGIWLIGAAEEGETNLFDFDLSGPIGIVMGAEGAGLRRLTKENCDHLLKIPMAGSVASLNVSVATGIFLFEAVRQRG